MSGVRAGHNVLDLAGGTGDLAALYAPLVGATGSVVLADINGAMINVGRDRLIDRISRHRGDQHPQRHLIRPHHHTFIHAGTPCQPLSPSRSRHADQIKNNQVNDLINLAYVALVLGPDGLPGAER
jgi:SAM-dependent methyltransferase